MTISRACLSTWFPAAAPQGGLKITDCPESPTDKVSGKVRHFIGNKERRHFPFFTVSVKTEYLKDSIYVDPDIVISVPPSNTANVAARYTSTQMEGFTSFGSLGFLAVSALSSLLGPGCLRVSDTGGLPGGFLQGGASWDCWVIFSIDGARTQHL